MSTKLLSIALCLPPALLAGGCIDRTDGNRQDVAAAAAANSAVASASAEEGTAASTGGGTPAGDEAVNAADAADDVAAAPAAGKEKSAAMAQGEVVVATRPAPADSGGKVTSPAGLVAGTLDIRSNCLVIVGASGVTTLPIFREGSFGWDAGARTLRYGGRGYRVGETLALPGGNLPRRSPFVADHRAVIDRCGAKDVFIVA